jgi:hypothetical protein
LGVGFTFFGIGGYSKHSEPESGGPEFRGPSISLSIERDLANWVSLGAFVKAQWPDATCSSGGDCSMAFYGTPDSGVTLVMAPRLGFRLSGTTSELSVLLGIAGGMSAAVSGRASDTSLQHGYFVQVDVTIAIPVARRWAIDVRFACSLLVTEHVSGAIQAMPHFIQFPEVSLGATYAF